MYVNIGGDYLKLYSGTHKAQVEVSSLSPEHLFWVMTRRDGTLLVICAPINQEAAEKIVEEHNVIYNSPLAKVMREEDS